MVLLKLYHERRIEGMTPAGKALEVVEVVGYLLDFSGAVSLSQVRVTAKVMRHNGCSLIK